VKKNVARCDPNPAKNLFSRKADALMLDIGINDVEFYRWVLGLILDEPDPTVAGGYVPCVAPPPPVPTIRLRRDSNDFGRDSTSCATF
jgi:hypothetical protein